MATRAAVMATATMWMMAKATRLVDDKEGKGEGGKEKCSGNEGCGRLRG